MFDEMMYESCVFLLKKAHTELTEPEHLAEIRSFRSKLRENKEEPAISGLHTTLRDFCREALVTEMVAAGLDEDEARQIAQKEFR